MQLQPHHVGTHCTFCNEFTGSWDCNFRLLFTSEEMASRIIRRSEHFVAIPGLGPIGDAYVLILPVKPFTCIAILPPALIEEFEQFKNEIAKAMTHLYRKPFAFEHGPAFQSNRLAGCCIEHAHIHLVSAPIDLLDQLHYDSTNGVFGLNTRYQPQAINSIADLSEWIVHGVAYIYYETAEGEQWGFPVTNQIESQFIRKKIARTLGLDDSEWDWLLFPKKTKVKQIWFEMTNYFKNL